MSGLDTIGGVARVTVHGVATPQHGFSGGTHRLDQPGQALTDAFLAETVNQCEPAGLIMRVQNIEQPDQALRRHVRTNFHADGVGDAAEIFSVGPRGVGGSHTDPGKVS